MPKQGQRAEVNTFIQGLITEASPLNFPPNASKEEENFILKRDGTRHRRLGIDYLTNYTFRPTLLGLEIFNKGLSQHIWTAVEGDTDREFFVVQMGSVLHFYDLSATETDGYLGEIVTTFPEDAPYQYASIEGKLVVTGGHPTIGIVGYVGDVLSFEEQVLKVRDFWGVQVA